MFVTGSHAGSPLNRQSFTLATCSRCRYPAFTAPSPYTNSTPDLFFAATSVTGHPAGRKRTGVAPKSTSDPTRLGAFEPTTLSEDDSSTTESEYM
jgi:hypothetical protein